MKLKITQTALKTVKIAAEPYEIIDTDLTGFLLRVQPSGKLTYYYAYRFNGRRARYKIGLYPGVKPVAAREAAEQLAAKVAQGVDPQAEKKQAKLVEERRALQTLKVFLDRRYEPWVIEERKTGAAMVQRIRACFPDLLARAMTDISPWVIDKWRAQRVKQGRAKATINRDIVALKSALAKAVEWKLIDEHPLIGVKPLKTDSCGSVRYLTKSEEKALREALLNREAKIRAGRESANKWRRERDYPLYPNMTGRMFADYLRPLVLLALNTGLRRGELFNLDWSSVNFQTKTLTVSGHTAKSKQTRHIPLNAEALEVLRGWRTVNTGLVFPGKEGRPMGNTRKSWAVVLEKAKITGFRFHDLRHTFASKLVMAGVDLNTVRELLGHADLKMTLRYAHLAPEHKADAVARLVAG